MRKLIESTLVSADGVVADPPQWALLDTGLTDELRLAVHPVLAGHGGLLFRALTVEPCGLCAVPAAMLRWCWRNRSPGAVINRSDGRGMARGRRWCSATAPRGDRRCGIASPTR